jgi:hypothetical protein
LLSVLTLVSAFVSVEAAGLPSEFFALSEFFVLSEFVADSGFAFRG